MPSVVILGGGPAGNTCASVAATLGADVTLVERDIVGGAAHLWDCIPSKALIATGGELLELGRAHSMGLSAEGRLDVDALRERVASIEDRLHQSLITGLESQQVRVIEGTGALQGPARASRRHAAGPGGAHRRLRRGRDGIAAADPRLRHDRRRADPHHPRRVPAAGDPRARGRDRLRRHRRGVHPPVRLARLAGHAARVAPAGAPASRTPRWPPCSRTPSSSAG